MNLGSYTERYMMLSSIFGLFMILMIAYLGVKLDRYLERKVHEWQQRKTCRRP